MTDLPVHPRDPMGWIAALTVVFLSLCLVRLTVPAHAYFDEVHYLPSARALLDLSHLANPEHPPLGKLLFAVGIALFGNGPLGWRAAPVLLGAIGFLGAMRSMWFATFSRFATLTFGVLLATSFLFFVHARIAMLDGIMVSFLLIALWMCAGALRENETARCRLAIAGTALGLAMAAKWNAAPLAVLPGLAFLVVRARSRRWNFATTSRGPPIRGMSLLEAAVWLGLLPLAVYTASYIPYAFLADGAVHPTGLIELHREMLALQKQVVGTHTYQSVWYDWALNRRAIWYLYEPVDGIQRGIMLIGNPLTMLVGLPAMVWCVWTGVKRKRPDAFAIAVLYAVSLGLWVVVAKPVQFYYHYLLPSVFLMAALALALDEFWQRRKHGIPLLVLGGSVTLFAYFWPIISAASLAGPDAFLRWTWLDSWR